MVYDRKYKLFHIDIKQSHFLLDFNTWNCQGGIKT